MTHFSPLNTPIDGKDLLFVVNITTPDCTYIKNGVVPNLSDGSHPIPSVVINELNNPILQAQRLAKMKQKLMDKHPHLAEKIYPITALSGTVDVVGNAGKRTSHYYLDKEKHYGSISIAKGVACVEYANFLVAELANYTYNKKTEKPIEAFISQVSSESVADVYKQMGLSQFSTQIH